MKTKVTKEMSLALLEKISDLALADYSNFDETEFEENTLRKIDDLKKLLEEPKILQFDKNTGTFRS